MLSSSVTPMTLGSEGDIKPTFVTLRRAISNPPVQVTVRNEGDFCCCRGHSGKHALQLFNRKKYTFINPTEFYFAATST